MKTLYLGPKVSMSLPFVLSYLKKLATILIATLFSLSAFSQELVFRNPVLVTGSNDANGAVYRFPNVTNNIDALLKIVTRSDSRVRLKEADYNGGGYDKAFQPRVEYNGGNVTGQINWWMEFEMSFVNRSGSTPVNVQSFNLTALDLDGDGASMLQQKKKNLSHFVIEKSINGVEFKEAAIIFTEGNSEILKSYAYRDPLAVDAQVIYYRLRMVDLDKTETFSSVRMIRASSAVKNQLELLTFPNPVVNELRITIPETWQNKQVTYEMFDGAGRLVKQVVNKSASQTEVFSMRSLNNGSYIIKAYTVEEGLVQRIIKN